jgi:hypothetical protein
MATNRAFFPQQSVDSWLAEGTVSLEGEVLVILPEGPAFLLTSAVRFLAEVAAGEDGPGLCGKVKTLPAIEELQGEYDIGSVVLGDYAYEVVDGFVGDLLEFAKEGWGAPKASRADDPRSTHAGPALRKSTGNSSSALRAVQSAKSGFSIPAAIGARPSIPTGPRLRASSPGPIPRARTSSVSIGQSITPQAEVADGPAPAPPPLSSARSALVALSELVSRG